MRLKFDVDNPEAYRCCFCCHVRTGTIFLGIFHLFVQLLVLSLFAVVVLHPDLVQQYRHQELASGAGSDDVQAVASSFTPETPENLSYDGNFNYNWVGRRQLDSGDKFLGLLITVGTFSMTVMLVYGAVRGRPGYLMPFFCLQVFDFCITCLTGVGYFSYIPDIKRWITAQEALPFKHELLQLNTNCLMLLAILVFMLLLTVKAYLIGVVWGCYKFLTNFEQRIARGVIRTNVDMENPDDTEMLLPPKYEDAVRMAADEPPPPPYVN